MEASYWIEKLDLKEHPEGGYFSEVYRHNIEVFTGEGNRSLGTSIYFLLKGDQKSHFHQLTSDEIWYFHQGSPVTVHCFQNGHYSERILGAGPEMNLQLIIEAGTIFAAAPQVTNSFCLMGCVVMPGFDFRDFRLLESDDLLKKYPEHRDLIRDFTLK